ncbi:hypothetical protein PIB30_069683 [Stylosanthes scabra]|uniref:Uncharacterized protein n=1 Tax=Stylosanthes scabra TaxID=79078 RepID=A0ABU6VQ50_9FABA|nr:hypothetical protein [Stylosanthes scabra]
MPRSKKTASKRQRQSDDVVYIEPPPKHQFARFFSRFDDLNHYVFNFHDRKEISPRIFKRLGIDFSNESGRMLAQQHVIDIRALHRMEEIYKGKKKNKHLLLKLKNHKKIKPAHLNNHQ